MSVSLRVEIFPADLDATADFYVRVLAFQIVRDERDGDPPYLAVQRDGVLIGAAQRPGAGGQGSRRPPVGAEIVLETDDVEREYARVVATRWPLAAELTHQPWGLLDFRLLDPSGYYLRLTESTRPGGPEERRPTADRQRSGAPHA